MSEHADELVKEMNSQDWSNVYDNQTIKVDRILPPIPERGDDVKLLIHTWIINNIEDSIKHLDVGCGEGWLLYRMKEELTKCPALYGIDPSPEAIKRAGEYAKYATIVEGFAEKLPYPDNSFHSVSCSQVIEHVLDPKVVIAELFRVCKPGGKILITTPILKNHDGAGASRHLHYFGFYDIMDLIELHTQDYKIFWLNKWQKKDEKTGVLLKKTCFAIRAYKGEKNE